MDQSLWDVEPPSHQLDVYTINERAIHLYERLGFQREGVMREAWRFDHGYYDIIMAILEDDYRALRP